jgi:hypothetical protein
VASTPLKRPHVASARSSNEGPTARLPASDYTPASHRPSGNDVSGRPGPISPQNGPPRPRETRDYTQHVAAFLPRRRANAGSSSEDQRGRYAAPPAGWPIHNFRSYLVAHAPSSEPNSTPPPRNRPGCVCNPGTSVWIKHRSPLHEPGVMRGQTGLPHLGCPGGRQMPPAFCRLSAGFLPGRPAAGGPGLAAGPGR